MDAGNAVLEALQRGEEEKGKEGIPTGEIYVVARSTMDIGNIVPETAQRRVDYMQQPEEKLNNLQDKDDAAQVVPVSSSEETNIHHPSALQIESTFSGCKPGPGGVHKDNDESVDHEESQSMRSTDDRAYVSEKRELVCTAFSHDASEESHSPNEPLEILAASTFQEEGIPAVAHEGSPNRKQVAEPLPRHGIVLEGQDKAVPERARMQNIEPFSVQEYAMAPDGLSMPRKSTGSCMDAQQDESMDILFSQDGGKEQCAEHLQYGIIPESSPPNEVPVSSSPPLVDDAVSSQPEAATSSVYELVMPSSPAEGESSSYLKVCEVGNLEGTRPILDNSGANVNETSESAAISSSPRKKRSQEIADISSSFESPAPKRMTLAAQQKQHKKLTTPFRSPLLQKPIASNSQSSTSHSLFSLTPHNKLSGNKHVEQSTPTASMKNGEENKAKNATPLSSQKIPASKSKNLLASTTKAHSQFKSPFRPPASAAVAPQLTSSSATMKALEGRMQLLKRAVQLKKTGEAEKLTDLIQRWRTAGRDVAWDLWAIVREQTVSESAGYDLNYPGTNTKSTTSFDWGGGGKQGSWGWAGSATTNSTSSWGWDQSATDNDDHDINSQEFPSPTTYGKQLVRALTPRSDVKRNTLLPPTPRGASFAISREVFGDYEDNHATAADDDDGKDGVEEGSGKPVMHTKSLGGMLTQFGITHETLGWDEEEGDFVDRPGR